MSTYVLMVNARERARDKIPHELWRSLLFRFVVPTCDGVSFDAVTEEADLEQLDPFADFTPALLRTDRYRPYSYPPGVHIETYRHHVAVFELDRWVAQLIAEVDFNTWNIANDGTHVDEIVFWSGSSSKAHAIPYEAQIYFHDLTPGEHRRLLSCEPRIDANLYVMADENS